MRSTDASPLAPGYKLDRYELLGPLAEGGMASVWIARQRGKHGFERLVAIKTILPQFASDDRFRQMFLDEASIASRIEHFNVARILDLGEEHEVLYLVMEYVEGDSLSKLRRESKRAGVGLPAGIALRVLADACAGLHEAHEMRSEDGEPLEIVHRDVSPHNILLSTRGAAKLIDFGIAKARDRLSGDTNAGVLKGKIQYMAPEQALGRHVDRRADIWAIGASLYHLLAGRAAFHAENTLEMLHLLTSGRPPEPLPESVHPSIAHVVHLALSNPPHLRFQTAAELRDALEVAMVEANVPTTQADVAAFVGVHLADRVAKRRRVIEIAVAAAAERERIEEVLKPQIDRATTGLSSRPGQPGESTVADHGAFGSAPPSPWPPPLEPSPLAQAMATDVLPPLRSRQPAVVALVFVVALALAAGFLFTTVRSRPPGAAMAGVPPAASPDAPRAPRIEPAAPPAWPLPAEGSAASSSSSALASSREPASPPSAEAQAQAQPAVRPAWTPPPPATPPRPGTAGGMPASVAAAPPSAAPPPPQPTLDHPTEPAPSATPRKRNVDDGF